MMQRQNEVVLSDISKTTSRNDRNVMVIMIGVEVKPNPKWYEQLRAVDEMNNSRQ